MMMRKFGYYHLVANAPAPDGTPKFIKDFNEKSLKVVWGPKDPSKLGLLMNLVP